MDINTIVFFGSGPVAAKALWLLNQDFEIEAVITKPQPEHHKDAFPVLDVIKDLGLQSFTPSNKSELSHLFTTKPVTSRLSIVIDYGIIIPQDVIDYFPLGIVNSHFSLLPQWRGADPISFAILNGDKETGVSLMLITAGLDEGPLLAQTPFAIPTNMTTPELTEVLIDISHQALKTIIPSYLAGEIYPAPQEKASIATTKTPSYSRKLTKEDGIIDWHKPAEQIEREIRAFIEWPKSRTTIAGKDVIITKAHTVPVNHDDLKPGEVETAGGITLMVECGTGTLCIDRLKPAGKREMSAREFLAGNKP